MDAPTFNIKETQEEVTSMLHKLDLHLNIKAFPFIKYVGGMCSMFLLSESLCLNEKMSKNN